MWFEQDSVIYHYVNAKSLSRNFPLNFLVYYKKLITLPATFEWIDPGCLYKKRNFNMCYELNHCSK